MASSSSTPVASQATFSPQFATNVPRYRRMIRSQWQMGQARAAGLHDDFEQMMLLEIARQEHRYDPKRAPTLETFLAGSLPSRATDCLCKLKRRYATAFDDTVPVEDLDAPRRHEGIVETPRVAYDDPVHDEVSHRHRCADLRSAMISLTPRQREVIELALEDQSDKDIAAALGVSVQAVNKTRLAAIARLQAAMVIASAH